MPSFGQGPGCFIVVLADVRLFQSETGPNEVLRPIPCPSQRQVAAGGRFGAPKASKWSKTCFLFHRVADCGVVFVGALNSMRNISPMGRTYRDFQPKSDTPSRGDAKSSYGWKLLLEKCELRMPPVVAKRSSFNRFRHSTAFSWLVTFFGTVETFQNLAGGSTWRKGLD